ncbi:hypothetical protein CNMCM6936_003368 [Aspergillus lentulus]|nr:hypothetical protein CNMCM6936_003368 [Aspergillus lentulus]
MTSPTLTHHDYTVAWICASPIEMAAAKTLLDEIHNPLSQLPTDGNTYTLGSMSGKNVVIPCLPCGVYGIASAASVVTQMRPTFPSLRFGLMVGIGGGVPNGSADIRLGDVVVSVPNETSGGVVQYDYGKTCLKGSFQRTGSLNKPPQILLTALSQMRCDTMLPNTQIGRIPSDYLQSNQTMQGRFARPANDWLFHSSYDPQSSSKECSSCDKNQLVQRAPRANDEPHIHYGLIASGNQVMKDARTRDAIARELNVLCFEMEAAGIMDQLPCLVIRGICDYCDSHKSDEWQQYAALTAAAYSKALLSIVPLVRDNIAQDQGRVPGGPEVYCIIDALDECESDSQETLLRQIDQSFNNPRTNDSVPFKSMDLGSYREITNDLRAMIRNRVEDLAWRKKYPKSVIKEVSQILEEKAAGTFLWVGVACGELARVQSRNAVKALQALPRGLHSLYQKLLNAAFKGEDENDRRVIKEMLGFVAFARRPLTLMEMAEACRLYLDKDMDSRLQFTREFIDLCRLLIVIDNGYVRLLHSSVQDFLILEIREINAMKANHVLSCRCIETILQKCQPGIDESEFDPEKGFMGYSEALGPGLAPIHVAAHWGILPLISSQLPASLENKDFRGQSPLLIAAQTVQIEAMHLLVESGSCVDSLNSYHENVLHVACQNSQYNNCAMTKFLLDRGTSPYVCDKDNMTPFLYAVGHQKETLARVFLQNGFDVNFRIQRRCWTGQMVNSIISYEMDESPEQYSKVSVGSGLTALHFSALNGSAKMTALLLQYGADPNARSDTGDTPLHLAIRRTLLEHKYDDPWISGVYAAESLRGLITDHESEAHEIYESIDRYRERIVETLLSSDTVDVNLANDQGDYPQHAIPFEKDYASSILCKLVAKGGDSSRLNGADQSCLHLASKAGNLEVVRKLADGGHDIMLPDVDGLSPFHHALCGGYSEVVRFMSTACESLLSKTWRSLDHFSNNLLHHHVASIYCSTGMIDFLVQRGCNVNDTDREGNSALSLYMGSFRLHIDRETFHLLPDKGADPLCVNDQKENPAHLFMHHRGADIEILQLPLKCGLDLAARDHEGKTVMHHCAIHGAFTHELVEFLRVNGVLDPYARDFRNKTPLDYAEEQTRRIWPQDYPGCDDRGDKSFICLKYLNHPCVA